MDIWTVGIPQQDAPKNSCAYLLCALIPVQLVCLGYLHCIASWVRHCVAFIMLRFTVQILYPPMLARDLVSRLLPAAVVVVCCAYLVAK